MKRLFIFLLALALCLGILSACGETAEETVPAEEDPEIEDGCSTLPGGILPELLVDGTLYHWARMSEAVPYIDETGKLVQLTKLPDGFEEAGPLGAVSLDPPEENFEMQAGFSASGTVYTDPERPLVVVVHMTTDWFTGQYVRFESGGLADHLIRWDGRLFHYPYGFGVPVRELPEGCVSIGTLTCVSGDILPAADLECNSAYDGYGKYLGGREVFQDPADPDVLYVFETQYWREGSYPAWEICRSWEPGDPLYPVE
ncbi:MAG: hypothetical protein HDT19_03080 [Oscillibacter sp.]|nr:hypothetical protein [Oscillibacter sp.]